MCRKQRKSPYQSDIGKDHQNLSLVEPTANATKHNSKGNGGTVALAAVHAESKRKRGERNLRRSSSVWKNLKFNFLKRSDPEMINKYDAASKIQRAWRNRVQFGACADEEQSNPAFEPNRLSVRNPPERRSTNIAVLGTLSQAPVGRMNSAETIIPTKSRSRFQSKAGKEHGESQVRSDMRELLGNRVAIGTLIMLIFTVLCTYTRHSTTQIKTMIVLHSQTRKPAYAKPSLTAAVNTTAPTLYQYSPSIGSVTWFPNPRYGNSTDLTERNIVKITVTDSLLYGTSTGWFDNSRTVKRAAILDIVATIFIIIFWYAGVLSFSGPVMLLVIAPVEQMVRLLGMLTVDPLGYQSTARYKEFLRDDDELSRNTRWSREVLKGMETSFLKSTILRIGSLMKVGFGSAGVEIIQNNLEKGHQKNMLILNSQGTTVSCIFLFSDIRQFTDATEQLQEEVFVFTNRIAAVVHSICNSYGGAANKNIGDAFLLSWSLDDNGASGGDGALKADKSQADKALLSVIKICIALTYDNFFLEPLSDAARGRLKSKLKDRTGSVVQMGFGLHAGKAVQGAIGSQRKIDATYVSESVERAEFLESSTKKYGLKMMMSGEFHRLLHSRTQGRCRKIDHILIRDKDDGYFEDYDRQGEFMDLFTFDMDVDAIQQADATLHNVTMGESDKLSNSSLKQTIRKRRKGRGSRTSLMNARDLMGGNSNNSQQSHVEPSSNSRLGHFDDNRNFLQEHRELVLPSGPALYAQNVWQSPDMRKIRDKYIKSFFFFQKYKSGLDAFYKKDWHHAKRCFRDILEHFDDGPSRYFLRKINENKGVPPKGFKGYGIAD